MDKCEYYLINNVYGKAMTIAFYRADDRVTYDLLMRRLRENEVIMKKDKNFQPIINAKKYMKIIWA